MNRLRAGLAGWRERPLLAVVTACFFAAWGLSIAARPGSTWHTFLSAAAWFLLVLAAIVALVGGPRKAAPE